MGNNFEFDKIVWAIAFGILTIIFSNNIGDVLYNPNTHVDKSGYKIEVKDDLSNQNDGASKELPAIIDINTIMSQANALMVLKYLVNALYVTQTRNKPCIRLALIFGE